jgi:anthranilate/para-aminobenzoate synthase component I
MNPRTPIEQLLRVAASLAPPFVLLEDGLGTGTSVLAWGARERLRLGWDAAALGSLERFTPGDGWIGALGYDLGLPPKAMRRDAVLAQPVVDLFRPVNRITLRPQIAAECAGPDAAAAWEAALGHGALGPPVSGAAPAPAGVPRRSFTQAGFEDAVRRALEHIRAGDIYQVNLSVAERVALREPPFAVYRRLRAINPSPWMGYADFGDWQLVCGSPELLVEVADGAAHAKPIAGTRKKTGDPAADAAMRRELVTDAKEAAEHVMLVDLARNDLGRIARYGTVRVAELGSVEEYSHVMHLVSDVRGTLAPGIGPWEVFRAMFPGGTITGCPKIRSMEIIADLEPVARGMYTGALGWWDGGEGQWNILIRSAVVRDGEAVLQAGAGVVADSDPAREWKESLRKAAALRAAFVVADT